MSLTEEETMKNQLTQLTFFVETLWINRSRNLVLNKMVSGHVRDQEKILQMAQLKIYAVVFNH